jgi:hypothetical protein
MDQDSRTQSRYSMKKGLETGDTVRGYTYTHVSDGGPVLEQRYAIICGRTVIRTQLLSRTQSERWPFDFPGAIWDRTASGLSPSWVIANCVCLGIFPNPLRKHRVVVDEGHHIKR